MKGLALAVALLFVSQAAPSMDPLDAHVWIYDGGSIYHRKDCVSLGGKPPARAVTLRELGHGWDACSYCRPASRPADARHGDIQATLPPLIAYRSIYEDLISGKVRLSIPVVSVPPDATTITPTTAAGPSIRQKCAADWPDDFQMRAHCENEQRQAEATIGNRSMTTRDQMTIRTKCQRDWSDDFRMRNYCEEQQLKALASIR
jgi:hypothetical protein